MLKFNMDFLETLCLSSIVQDFERFHFACTVSKDVILQRNFDFLWRRFSVKLNTALYESGVLKDDYFRLLLNPYLESLVVHYLYNMDGAFCRLKYLTRICFRECEDKDMECIAQFCPKLVEIDLRNSYVSNNGVKYLCQSKNGTVPCPDLKKIFIKETSVTDMGAECLIRNLPMLEWIDHLNVAALLYSIYKQNTCEMGKMYSCNLVELDLSGCIDLHNYTDILELCLTVSTKLDSVACYVSSENQLDLLTNSRSHLKKLCLKFLMKVVEVDIDDFLKANGHNLISLNISSCSVITTICNVSISVLALHCPLLQEFCVFNVKFTDPIVDEIQTTLLCLVKCSISYIGCSADKAVHLILSSSPNLESLSLRCLTLSPETKSRILMWCKKFSVKVIDFEHLNFEINFLRDILLSCDTLEAMFLGKCKFDASHPKEYIRSLIKCLPKKPKLYFEKPSCFRDIDENTTFVRINHISHFLDKAYNLESFLKEEYKPSGIYNYLFYETAFDWDFEVQRDDWKYKWENLSS